MSTFFPIEQTPCDIKFLPRDMCQITFTIHQSEIKAFQMIFESLGVLLRGLAWKAKTNIHAVHQRIQEKELVNDEIIQQYHADVCEMFNSYLNDSTPRESFSLTVSGIKQKWPNSSYDQVKQILIKAKLLKNTGFYKKR